MMLKVKIIHQKTLVKGFKSKVKSEADKFHSKSGQNLEKSQF